VEADLSWRSTQVSDVLAERDQFRTNLTKNRLKSWRHDDGFKAVQIRDLLPSSAERAEELMRIGPIRNLLSSRKTVTTGWYITEQAYPVCRTLFRINHMFEDVRQPSPTTAPRMPPRSIKPSPQAIPHKYLRRRPHRRWKLFLKIDTFLLKSEDISGPKNRGAQQWD
jgi:hypothetical protein